MSVENTTLVSFANLASSLQEVMDLENKAGVSAHSRPRDLFDNPSACNEYIDYLQGMIEEEMEGDNPPALSLVQVDKMLIKINRNGLVKDRISKHPGIIFHSDPNSFSRIKRDFFVLKSDLAPTSIHVSREYKHFKIFWDQLSSEERERVMPLWGAEFLEGKFRFYITSYFAHDLSMCVLLNNNPEKKVEVSRNIIRSLLVVLKKGFIQPDIRPENMLYKEDGSAVLCDPDGITDFKRLIKKPTLKSLNQLRISLRNWTPKHLIFSEFKEVYQKLRILRTDYNQYSQKEIRDTLLIMYNRLVEMNKFGVGSSLYWLFASCLPHPVMRCEFIAKLSSEYESQQPHSIAQDEVKKINERNLTISGCPPKLKEIILEMVDPVPSQRPSLEKIEAFISSAEDSSS